VRFLQGPPDAGGFYQNVENTGLAVSPDGLRIALTARDASGVLHAWLRSVSSASATLLPDTDGATSLFWSPDGRSLAFFAGPRLRRMDFPGGTPVTVCEVRDGIGFSGSWGADGQILFASIEGEAIYSVSSSGGAATALLKPDTAKKEARLTWPLFLPDGRRFLYLLRSRDAGGRLMLAEPGKRPREVTPMQSNVGYVDPGYLVFGRDGTLVGQGFDLAKGTVVGAPFSIANPVNYFYTTTLAQFAVSASGTLVYQPQSDLHHMVWFDRSGRETGRVSEDGLYRQLQISPDGRRLAFSRQAAGANDVWELDFERGAETRLTFGVSGEQSGPWMPDGRSLMFNAGLGAPPEIFRKDLTTGAEKLVVPGSGTMQDPQDISPDGKTLLYVQRGNGGDHIWMFGLDGASPPAQAIESNFEDYGVRFSRDGRYFSYSSNSSGRQEVYLSPFPPTGEKVRVSTAGGGNPRWSRDTPELFYLSPAGQVMSAVVQTKPTLHVQSPVALFTVNPAHSWREFDVAPGNRFLAVVLESRASGQPVTVVLNWSPDPQTATR
jgi:Tol biopolymer transport system component